MANVFMATLGQRPAAITMALDKLIQNYQFEEIVILHTDPVRSGIAGAWEVLEPELKASYDVTARGCELLDQSGKSIIDVNAHHSAEGYYHGILHALSKYKRDGFTIHLLIAGGRKSMSVYATLAASLLFGMHDQLWTVTASDRLVNQHDKFHLKGFEQNEVTLVNMPILPNRLLPGINMTALLEDPIGFLTRRRNLREDFLMRLTKRERKIVEMLDIHPDATNAELGNLLHVAERTVENHLRSIYQKMTGFFDYGEQIVHKRQALLSILEGKV